MQCVSRLNNTTNWLVVAIDEELADYCKERGINHYHRPVQVRIAADLCARMASSPCWRLDKPHADSRAGMSALKL